METSITKQQLFSKDDLKKLIIPLLFEQALAITVGMADTVMISSAGEAAVSGVSLIDMFNNLIISVLAALATGGAVVTSQFLGAGKKEDACKSAKQLIVSSVCITIGISILVMVFCNGIITEHHDQNRYTDRNAYRSVYRFWSWCSVMASFPCFSVKLKRTYFIML